MDVSMRLIKLLPVASGCFSTVPALSVGGELSPQAVTVGVGYGTLAVKVGGGFRLKA